MIQITLLSNNDYIPQLSVGDTLYPITPLLLLLYFLWVPDLDTGRGVNLLMTVALVNAHVYTLLGPTSGCFTRTKKNGKHEK